MWSNWKLGKRTTNFKANTSNAIRVNARIILMTDAFLDFQKEPLVSKKGMSVAINDFSVSHVKLWSCIILFPGLAYLILPLDFNIPVPWLAINYRPWRLYTFICALPLGIGMVMMLFLYESPKFIANKGNEETALDILRRIYKRNGGSMEEYSVNNVLDFFIGEVRQTGLRSTRWREVIITHDSRGLSRIIRSR